MKALIIYFSRADENYAVGYIDKGNTEIVAEFVRELTGADPCCESGRAAPVLCTDKGA